MAYRMVEARVVRVGDRSILLEKGDGSHAAWVRRSAFEPVSLEKAGDSLDGEEYSFEVEESALEEAGWWDR